jgi:hypothetical protein
VLFQFLHEDNSMHRITGETVQAINHYYIQLISTDQVPQIIQARAYEFQARPCLRQLRYNLVIPGLAVFLAGFKLSLQACSVLFLAFSADTAIYCSFHNSHFFY